VLFVSDLQSVSQSHPQLYRSELSYGEVLGDKSTLYIRVTYTEGTCLYCDCFILVCILYCGCFTLFCNVWVCVCVGVLVICVLVFTVFCIVCTVFLYCFVYVYLFLIVLSVLV
jgi:hypothetical protein